ncbi:hypothetical protein [Rhodocytophaga aerolata]|nr:hypothetical protein [Rhodocytophaga aerolata]
MKIYNNLCILKKVNLWLLLTLFYDTLSTDGAMNRAEFINKLLKLDPGLAVRALRNDRLTAKLKVTSLLKELRLLVKDT